MKEIKTSEGLLIMKTTNTEFANATNQDFCLCDNCYDISLEGYYVAVLNRWICPLCYMKWKTSAIRYIEDISAEERNYKFYKKLISKI